MKKILFSIITTTYNRVESGYLEQNIRAAQDQESAASFEYEHIIVDDGSTDGTRDFVSRIARDDKRIRYYYQENAGPAKATSTGIAKAKGDFVIIVDDDDLLTSDSLKLRSEVIINNPEVDFFYGLADWIDQYGLPIPPLFQSRRYDQFLYERMLISNCINAGTPTIRRTELLKIKTPKWLKRSQDYFLWLELLRPQRDLAIMYIDSVLVRYRYHLDNYTSGLNDVARKADKAALNLRIKQLHEPNLVYLAEEAYQWVNEAHAANGYRLQQLKDKDARIDELQAALNGYAHSRFVRLAVKFRNVLRGQVLDRIRRLHSRLGRTGSRIISGASPMGYRRVDNDKWDPKRPLISVITPFYNRQDTMPETIQSVLGQTFQDFEYIIVNDGSTDEDADTYLSKINHPKITIVNQANAGVASARNTGVQRAQGKYIICLDSDDMIEPTYLEKSAAVLEANHNISIVSYDMQMFGVKEDIFHHADYDPLALIDDNPILTSAVYRAEVWKTTGGYKSDIGYEDWEFWVNAAENGHFGVHIPEKLFKYRTAEVSRYVDDLSNHQEHTSFIRNMHPDFIRSVKKHLKNRQLIDVINPNTALINLDDSTQYRTPSYSRKQVLVVVPWMTFGGAETLIYNYCNEVKSGVDLTFVTGLESPHEWEYKFRELTSRIYHLANMFDDEKLYLEFISNLVSTRSIDIMHIVHSGYTFSMLEELKKRHPKLKVIVTLFNDRAAYFEQAVEQSRFIDSFTTDNSTVADNFNARVSAYTDVRVIPNGVDAAGIYNPELCDRNKSRLELGLKEYEIAIFFIGRLSEEKNPDVFIEAAKQVIAARDDAKFFIIGDGQMRAEVELAIGAMKTDRIEYLGYKSTIVDYLSAADVFILPSSIEGFPLSILEAMAMGVITIASDVGAVSDVIENGLDGYIVNPGSVDDIVELVISVNRDDDYQQMSKSARQKVLAKYSTEQLGNNYKRLYGVE